MAESIAGLTGVQLREIKKWKDMKFTPGQVGKKMDLPTRKVFSAFKYIDSRNGLL